EEGAHGRTDTASAAPGRGWRKGGRHLPRARSQRSDLLRVEEEVFGLGIERATRTAAAARGERQAQAVGRGSFAGPAHAAGDCPKKAVRPRQRRELGRWTQAAFAVSTRRVAGLMLIDRSTMSYRSRRDPQDSLRMRLHQL